MIFIPFVELSLRGICSQLLFDNQIFYQDKIFLNAL